MKCHPDDIRRLLKEISEELQTAITHSNFHSMHEQLEARYKAKKNKALPCFKDYLYRKLYLKVKDEDSRRMLQLSPTILNALCECIGYENFDRFRHSDHPAVLPVLKNCMGAWYSYVRCNSGQAYVLRAPVHIYQQSKTVWVELQGSTRLFKGKLKSEGDCLSCLLESNQHKNIHLLFKAGLSNTPGVLQGVFSAISNGGEPVAGREILVRQQGSEFSKMKHARLPIEHLVAHGSEEEKLVGNYFAVKNGSILKANRSSSFELDDLVLSKE